MPFTATARIPCRPLSYDNKEIANPKEFIIDYTAHKLYLSDVNGNIVDISIDIDSIKDQLEELIKKNNANILKEITITLSNGDTIIAETAIINCVEQLIEIKNQIKNGELIDTLPAEKVVESNERQFVSAADKEKWNSASDKITNLKNTIDNLGGLTDVFMTSCIVKSGVSAWTKVSDIQYTQTITVDDILETDNPVIDVSVSDDYSAAENQLINFDYIYKITTANKSIKVFATKYTDTTLTLQIKVDRKNS